MQLSGVCPPDPPWAYMTPPYQGYGMQRPAAAAGPRIVTTTEYNPYATESRLEGGLGLVPAIDPQKTRWDIVAIAGGGVLLVALTLGFIASR